MDKLNQGDKIELQDGSFVTITDKLGQGGQGEVYKVVDSSGDEYALKWYTSPDIINKGSFYTNLLNNTKAGAPAENFLWPLKVTKRQKDSFGYIMHLRPERFRELGEMFRVNYKKKDHAGKTVMPFKDSYFKSKLAKLNAAIQLCNGFRRLHLSGYSYQDLNEGNFFIDFKNGDVLVCDNDNVVANGENLGVSGKVRYMAPEVVKGASPNIDSDYLSLAIILYRLFMTDHPFEGLNTLKHPNLNQDYERRLFGEEAVFCYDAIDPSNRPAPNQDINSIRFWAEMTPKTKIMFQKALSKRALTNPKDRIKEKEWREFFLNMRRNLEVGQKDGKLMENWSDGPAPDSSNLLGARLRFSDNTVYNLYPNKPLYLGDKMRVIGVGTTRLNNAGGMEMAIKNISKDNWTLHTASGKTVIVKPEDVVPLRKDMNLYFPDSSSCVVQNL